MDQLPGRHHIELLARQQCRWKEATRLYEPLCTMFRSRAGRLSFALVPSDSVVTVSKNQPNDGTTLASLRTHVDIHIRCRHPSISDDDNDV